MPRVLAVARFELGDHAAGFVAQRAHLIERRMRALGDEAAIAGEERRLGDEQRVQPFGQRDPIAAKPSVRRATISSISPRAGPSGSPAAPSSPQERARRGEPIADGAEIARAAARERQPAHRARDIGRGFQRGADALAQIGQLQEVGDGIEPRGDGGRIGQAARRGAGRGRARRLRSRCSRSRESRLPRRSPPSVSVSSRLRRVARRSPSGRSRPRA